MKALDEIIKKIELTTPKGDMLIIKPKIIEGKGKKKRVAVYEATTKLVTDKRKSIMLERVEKWINSGYNTLEEILFIINSITENGKWDFNLIPFKHIDQETLIKLNKAFKG